MATHPVNISEQIQQEKDRVALLELQARRRIMEHATRKQRKLLESSDAWEWVNSYSDVIDRFQGTGRDLIFPFSTATDRRYGANWPFYRTWQEHARLRAASRLLWGLSPNAFGAVNALVSYIIGEGMQVKAVGRKDDVPEEIIDTVQLVLDEIVDQNNYLSMQQEVCMRDRRDGESFIRKFPQNDGITIYRIVEPECVIEPPGYSLDEYSFGIGTDPDDLYDWRSIFVSYSGSPSDGEHISNSEFVASRSFTDGGVKRGTPDFAFDSHSLLKTTGRLLESMGQGAAIRACIAFVRQHSQAPQAAVADFISGMEAYTETSPYGNTQSVLSFNPGMILDMDKGQDFVNPPGSDNVGAETQVVQALLQAVAVRWNAPDWIITGNNASVNFASSLTSESQFVKSTKRFQGHYARIFRQTLLAALQHYCWRRGGIRVKGERYTWDTIRRLVDINVVPPTVEVRDKLQEATRNKMLVEMGVKSRQTVAQEEGLKFKTEERNNEEWEKKHGKDQQGGGGRPPGMGGLGAMLGGGGGPGDPPDAGPPGAGGNQQPDQGQQGQDTGEDDTADLEAFLATLESKARSAVGAAWLTEGLVFRPVHYLLEACVPNQKGHGYHNDDTGWPCSPNASDGGFFAPDTASPAGNTSSAPSEKRAVIADLVKKAGGLASGAKLAAEKMGEKAWNSLSPFQRKGASLAFTVGKALYSAAEFAIHKGEQLALQTARERGLPEDQVSRVGKVLAVTDQILAWTTTFPTTTAVTGNPLLGKAASLLPMASLAYLAYSTARDPLATLRAARKLLTGKAQPVHEAEGDSSSSSVTSDDVEGLLTLLSGASDPDQMMAMILVAFDETKDLGRALAMVAQHGRTALTESVQPLIEKAGRGTDKRGRVICWNDSGHRVSCGDKSHQAEHGAKHIEAAHEHLKRLTENPRAAEPEHIQKAAAALSLLTTQEVKELQKQYGLRGGGKKEELIHKVAKAATRQLNTRQHYEREARKAGVSPRDVHAQAMDYHQAASAWVRDARRAVLAARQAYRTYSGGKNLSRNMPGFKDGDPSKIPHLDKVAADLAGMRDFGGIFSSDPDADNTRILYDLLLTGGPPLPAREDAYRQALDWAKSEKQKGLDDVPFDVPGEQGWEKEFAGEPEFLREPEGETKTSARSPLPTDEMERQQWLANLGGTGRTQLMDEAEGWWQTLSASEKKDVLASVGIRDPKSKMSKAFGWPPNRISGIGDRSTRVLLKYAELIEKGVIQPPSEEDIQSGKLQPLGNLSQKEATPEVPKQEPKPEVEITPPPVLPATLPTTIDLAAARDGLSDQEIAGASDENLKKAMTDIKNDYWRGLPPVLKSIVRRFEESGVFNRSEAEEVVRAHRDYWKERIRQDAEADAEFTRRMDRNFGSLSLEELQDRIHRTEKDISDLQHVGRREMTGAYYGRRTGPAVANEAARGAGQEKMELTRYLREKAEAIIASGGEVSSSILADAKFTGTDSLGRKWVNGELVAKQEEVGQPSQSQPSTSPKLHGRGLFDGYKKQGALSATQEQIEAERSKFKGHRMDWLRAATEAHDLMIGEKKKAIEDATEKQEVIRDQLQAEQERAGYSEQSRKIGKKLADASRDVNGLIHDYREYDAFRRVAVEKALAAGKPVPAEVLADYPDLAKQAEPTKEPAPETSPDVPPVDATPQSDGTRKAKDGEGFVKKKPEGGFETFTADAVRRELGTEPKKEKTAESSLDLRLPIGNNVGGKQQSPTGDKPMTGASQAVSRDELIRRADNVMSSLELSDFKDTVDEWDRLRKTREELKHLLDSQPASGEVTGDRILRVPGHDDVYLEDVNWQRAYDWLEEVKDLQKGMRGKFDAAMKDLERREQASAQQTNSPERREPTPADRRALSRLAQNYANAIKEKWPRNEKAQASLIGDLIRWAKKDEAAVPQAKKLLDHARIFGWEE